MAELNDWDVTDANNNAAPPDGWPENTMNYNEVNDTGRAVQGTMKRFFADINGSLVGTGVANAYTVTLNSNYTAYFDGLLFTASIPSTNTGSSTFNVNSIGLKTIKDIAGNTLQGGELEANGMYSFYYDGTDIRVLNVFAESPDIRFDASAAQRIIRSENPAGTGQFALTFETNGDFGLYDVANTRYVGYYDQSANSFNFTTATLTENSNTLERIASSATTTATGSSVTISGIPSWATEITISFTDLTCSSIGVVLDLFLGDSGGIETTSDYSYALQQQTSTSGNVFSASAASGFAFGNFATSSQLTGEIRLTLVDDTTNTWAMSFNYGDPTSTTPVHRVGSGRKSVSATLTQFQFALSTGNFSGGKIKAHYKG